MSNPPEKVNLLPSEAYTEAIGSLVYRLSELMFGSLLASYCLGFVGAIAAALGSQLSEHGPLGVGLLATQYICVSVMFTYLTTSFYLTYHVGILTLPKMPFDSIGRDFRIAVFQAVFFGLSLLQPALFPILLAMNIFISGRRKNEEYKRVEDDLFNHSCPRNRRDESSDLPRFRKALESHMRNKPRLSVWAPVGLDIKSIAFVAVFIGVIVICLCLALEYGKIAPPNFLFAFIEWLKSNSVLPTRLREWMQQILLTPWGLRQILVTCEVLLATYFISWRGRLVLQRHASFIGFPPNKSHDIDTEFQALPAEVEKLCGKLFSQR
jgi:hypothetical protein